MCVYIYIYIYIGLGRPGAARAGARRKYINENIKNNYLVHMKGGDEKT